MPATVPTVYDSSGKPISATPNFNVDEAGEYAPPGGGDVDTSDLAKEATLAQVRTNTEEAATNLATLMNDQSPAGTVTALRELAVTLTLDTSAYADGDLMFENIEITNAARDNDVPFAIVGCVVIGEDDQGQPFDIYFHNTSSDWGTLNAAPTLSDADARAIRGRLQILSADFYDLGGVRIAHKSAIYIPLTPVSGSRSIRISGISRGTGTYTANGIRLVFFVE